jgi:hypothetical protein
MAKAMATAMTRERMRKRVVMETSSVPYAQTGGDSIGIEDTPTEIAQKISDEMAFALPMRCS